MSDARKKAEEALAKWDRMFHGTTLYSRGAWDCAQGKCVSALRLLLAAEPEAALLPLEAPECNDGDDCCRYCGRGLQPCGACKAPPPADAATEAGKEARNKAVDALAEWSCTPLDGYYPWLPPATRHAIGMLCDALRLCAAALAARRGDV